MIKRRPFFISRYSEWISVYRIRWRGQEKYRSISVLYTDDFKLLNYKESIK